MASHHHYQHQPPTSCGCTRKSCSCGCHCNQSLHCNPPPPPPPLPSNAPPTDPLVQALASQLLPSNSSHAFTHYPQNLHSHSQFPHLRQRLHNQEPISAQEGKTHLVISSLLARIKALEASLYRYSSHRSAASFSYSHSIRDLAASVIQRHFRAFLVRRSRTLWHLKELAMMKSAFYSLKSNQTHFDFQILSRKATALLFKLDSIKGSDPMVRDGKSSISRDLVRFLDFIDSVSVKRHELSSRSTRNARHGVNCDKSRVFLSRNSGNLHASQREVIGKLKDRVEKMRGFTRYFEDDEEDVELEGFLHNSDHDDEVDNPKTVSNGKSGRIRYGALVRRQEVQPRVKKSVSFAEERNMSMVLGNTEEPISHGEGTCLDDGNSSDDHEELVDILCSEVERIKSFSQEEEEEEMSNADISKTSYEGRRSRARNSPRIEGSFENEDSVFSAPLPVQMEAKTDLLKRINDVTILR